MALVLCLTLLPTAALADELGPVDGTSTVETAGADAEAEAKAKAGAEAVAAVQAMINALPDALTEENAGDVSAMLGEIDAAMAALGDEERAALDLTQYQAAIAALAALAAAQGEIALYADEGTQPTEGSGLEGNPYLIGTLEELKWFRTQVNSGNNDICAKLTADITLSEWEPIGTQGSPYKGTFDGSGCTISGASVPDSTTQDWGLFGYIGSGGTVKWIVASIEGLSINCAQSGVIAAHNAGIIECCSVDIYGLAGSLSISEDFGLIAYENSGTIENCRGEARASSGASNLNASDGAKAAGIAFDNSKGTIQSCYFSGRFRYTISGDSTTGYTATSDDYAIASNRGTITNCYYLGDSRVGIYLDDTVADASDGIVGVPVSNWQQPNTALNSGAVTWKLNGSDNNKTDPWRQDFISSTRQGTPTLNRAHGRVTKNDDGSYKLETPHTHWTNGELKEFTAVNSASDCGSSGYYYLNADNITLSKQWEISGDAILCLNGKTLTTAGENNIAVKNGTLTLMDDNGAAGQITGTGGSCIAVSGGMFKLENSKISGNTTGVTLNGGAFTMQGGEISGNTVGVHVQSGDLTLGGKAQVTGNDKNILLAQGSEISFDSLDPSAKFGISVEGQENLSDRVAVTDMTGGQYFGQLVADGFKDNGVGFELYLSDDGKTVMLGKQSAHTHCICGGRNTNLGHTSHSDVTFQPWRETDKLPTSGNYYLTRNVTLTKNATLQNANVCLNGYTVTLSNVGRINPSGTTQLTDCSVDGKGKLESYAGKANGGVAISRGNKFSLYGGTLNGVKVEIGQTGGGTFNMYGGKITGNTQGTVVGQSKTGGNQSAITINMYGGEISGNHIVDQYGGGVFVGNGNQFNMYGGKIQNNSAVDGGGVYIAPKDNAYQAGTMTIRGDAVIQNNKAGDSTNNVSLPSGSTIKIDGQMDASAQIGVTTRAGLSAGTVTIATATGADWVAAKNFTSDKSAYHVGLAKDGMTVQLQVHSHQWKYSVSPDGTTITAKCTAGNCDLADSNGGSVKIVAPSGSLIYDGNEHTATVNKSQDWQGDAVAEADIKYTKDGDATFTGNPKDAGTYTASITVGGVTASVKYTIKKATPTASDFTFQAPASSDLTYDGNAKTATVEPNTGINGMGAVTVKYFKNGAETEPKVAGDYTVKVSVAEGANYNATTDDLTTDDWKFTIGKATQTITVPTDKTIVKDGIAEDISDWATVAGVTGGSAPGMLSYTPDGSYTGVALEGNQLTVDSSVATGTTITIKVTAEETGNYNKEEQTFTVKVADKNTATVTITGLPDTVTYGQEFTLTASQTGDTTGANKKWTWDYDQEYFKRVGPNANTETITLQAIKASTPSKDITATYESGTHKGSATVNAVVEKKEVTVSGIAAENKEYDGGTTATVNASGATITGEVDGDDLTVSVAAGSTFDSADAGSRTVTLGTLTLGGTSAGNYTLAASGNQTTATANITAKNVSISAATVNDKDYDGNANATVPSVTITGVSSALSMGTDFDVTSATFPDADADTANVDVTINVALKGTAANNYNLTNGMGYVVTSAAKINKATYSGPAPTKTVNILKNYAGVQTGTLTAADFFTTAPAEAKITVLPSPGTVTIMSSVDVDASGNLTYHSKPNIAATADENCAVTISSKNYTDINATLTFKLVDKTDVNAQITFPNGTLTYNGAGQKYEKATISGVSGGTWNYTYVANSGTGASLDSAGLPKTAGTYTVTAKYEDDAHIGTKNATLTVSKATPTGAPTCTKITTSGKTLADAPLAIGTIAPAGGTLAWDMAANTVVAANTAYGWTYTPADTANYKALTGSLTPYAVSSGGGGGGGSAATPSVSDKAAKELKNAKEGSTVAIDMKGETKLPASVTKEIAGKDVTVELDMGGGTVWSFNGLDVPKGGVRLDLGVKTGTKTIPAKVINALTGEATTIQLQLDHNGPFGISLKLSVDLGKKHDGLYANLYFYNPKSGELEFQSASMISGGKASWAFDHASDCAIVIDKESHEPMTFTDVPDTAYYAEAVNWAVAKKITEGIGNKLFGSNDPCTRAQIVTFLWRAAGSPGPKTMSGFSDVPADSYYAKAVAWAVENGITGGTGDGKFSPDATCTRAQAVTFLYRASGAPAVSGNAAFSDVATNAYYEAAVKWAEKNGITGGIGGGLFGSDNNCTRAQIVTFLYRNYQSK